MIQVTIGAHRYSLPERWQELSPKQYLAVMAAYAMPGSRQQFQLQVLQALMGAPWHRFSGLLWGKSLRRGRLVWAQSVLHQYTEELLPVISFITENTPFHHQPMPRLKAGLRQWQGPQQQLLDVTGGELEITENLYSAYTITRDLKWLRKLMAVLWRPTNWRGQRLPFNDAEIDRIERQQQRLSDACVWGVKLFYEGCMQQWMKQQPEIFKKEGNTQPDPEAWRKLLRNLAGPVRGTVDEVRKMTAGEIFFEMGEREKEYRQEKMRQMKNKHKPR